MALDRQNEEMAYSLGRLFAVLEDAQTGAQGDLNTTIKDRYFSAAASTPGRVFPVLLGKSANHFSKLKKDKFWLCKKLEEETNQIFIEGNLGKNLPKTLSADEQGSFYLGYHQERASLWASKKKKDTSTEKDPEE